LEVDRTAPKGKRFFHQNREYESGRIGTYGGENKKLTETINGPISAEAAGIEQKEGGQKWGGMYIWEQWGRSESGGFKRKTGRKTEGGPGANNKTLGQGIGGQSLRTNSKEGKGLQEK